ncbi:fimbrial protein [Escherichia coli]
MKKVFAKSLLVAAMFSVAGSAFAVQKDITVTANVDAALDMTQTDNTALPKAVEMQYLPGQGLQSYQLMTKIWSNDTTKDVKMQLVSPAQLVQSVDASKIVPLTVTWGGEVIAADAATTFTATEIFASDAVTNGSLAKPLMFSQTTKGILETGIYRGVVSIYLSQAI